MCSLPNSPMFFPTRILLYTVLQAENGMTGRAYMGEVLIATSLTEQMSGLFDKQSECVKESLKKNFQGSCKLLQAHKKVCNENESRIRNK